MDTDSQRFLTKTGTQFLLNAGILRSQCSVFRKNDLPFHGCFHDYPAVMDTDSQRFLTKTGTQFLLNAGILTDLQLHRSRTGSSSLDRLSIGNSRMDKSTKCHFSGSAVRVGKMAFLHMLHPFKICKRGSFVCPSAFSCGSFFESSAQDAK